MLYVSLHTLVFGLLAMTFSRILILLALAAPGLAACTTTSEAPPPAAAPAGPPPVTGWLAGPVGEQLDAAERERAFAAQITAAETGRRASWRSTRGNFGFVEPGADAAGCRSFNHTLYIDGKAQRGAGNACRNAAGVWQVS
jgi:surface antigen